MQIFVAHPELDSQETRLSADVAAAATTSTVENNKSFATNDYVVFGNPGEELTEIVPLTSTSGTTTLGHTVGPVFAHSARTSVSQIRYNQAKVYSATSEDGSYSLVATVDLTLDQDSTVYNDSAGTSSTWYKIKYYNATTTALSSYSVAVQGTGYTEDSLRSMTDEVLTDFGDPLSKDLSRDQVANYLRGGVRKITTELMKTYPDYFKTYTTQALTAGDYDYSLPTGFLGFIRVDVNYTGSSATDAYKATFISESFGDPDTSYYETQPFVAIRGSTLILRPTPSSSSGYAFVWYWAYPTSMTDDNDEHGLPYGARDVLVNYALYRTWQAKDLEKANSYKSLFKESLEDYVDFVSQSRQQMTTSHVEVITGSDMYESE